MSGWIPALNGSFSIGSTTGEGFPIGMNRSLGIKANRPLFGGVLCVVVHAMVEAVLEHQYPPFVGWWMGGGGQIMGPSGEC